MTTRFRNYFMGMSQAEREAYAQAAGTTAGYIQAHLARIPPRKNPSRPTLEALVAASGGDLTWGDMFEHFFPSEDAA